MPSSAARRLSTARSAIAARAVVVAEPMWGTTSRFGASSSGWSGGSGSGSVTSSAGAGERALVQRVGERVLVDDRAARGVDEDRRRLHGARARRRRSGGGSRRVSGRVERDEVRALERGVEVVAEVDHDDLHLEPARRAWPRPGRCARRRRRPSVAPWTSAPIQPCGSHVRHWPSRRRPGGLDDAAGDREHQRPGEVGRRVGEHVGRVADLDAARRRRVDVDVVEADRVVGDRAQLRRGVEQLGVDPVDEQRQQPLGLAPRPRAAPRAAAACRPARPRRRARRRGAPARCRAVGG